MALSNEPKQLLNMVLDTLSRNLEIDCAWVQFVSSDNRELVLAASSGFTPSISQEMFSVSMAHGLAMQVVGLGNKVLIPDLRRDGTYGLHSLAEAGLTSVVAVPMRTHRTCGIMGIASRTRNKFRQQDADLLMTVAGIVIIALDKAGLYQRIIAGTKRIQEPGRLEAATSPDGAETEEDSDMPTMNSEAMIKQTGQPFEEHHSRMKTFRKTHKLL